MPTWDTSLLQHDDPVLAQKSLTKMKPEERELAVLSAMLELADAIEQIVVKVHTLSGRP